MNRSRFLIITLDSRRSIENDLLVTLLQPDLPAPEPLSLSPDELAAYLADGLDPAQWAAALKVLHHMKDKLTAENAVHDPHAAAGE